MLDLTEYEQVPSDTGESPAVVNLDLNCYYLPASQNSNVVKERRRMKHIQRIILWLWIRSIGNIPKEQKAHLPGAAGFTDCHLIIGEHLPPDQTNGLTDKAISQVDCLSNNSINSLLRKFIDLIELKRGVTQNLASGCLSSSSSATY